MPDLTTRTLLTWTLGTTGLLLVAVGAVHNEAAVFVPGAAAIATAALYVLATQPIRLAHHRAAR